MGDINVAVIESSIGYTFTNPALADLAFQHASVADTRVASNERLEFLGDAVLGMVACQRIYELFPDMLEGEMTKIKSTVVSRQVCAIISIELGLHEHLQLGKGMRTGAAAVPMSLAAAALESVVAAIFLDGGLEPARRFLLPLLEPRISAAAASKHQENYKSLLQHHVQQTMSLAPRYIVLAERGPDHAKNFLVCVEVGTKRHEASWGISKKHAEQQAAMLALQEMGVLTIADSTAIPAADQANAE